MFDNHGRRNGAVGHTVVMATGGLAGVWADDPGHPHDKVIELLGHDGRVTTIVQRADGHLEVCTDGLRAAAHAVRVAADGTAAPVTRRSR